MQCPQRVALEIGRWLQVRNEIGERDSKCNGRWVRIGIDIVEFRQDCAVLQQYFDDSGMLSLDGQFMGRVSICIDNRHAGAGLKQACRHVRMIISCSRG
jgi:hypothetical protein